ncbi:MAG: hypothetical protein GXP37_13865 [Chloroflexi bacterium]|nr:hypothetical protein [Chloroflexota bacterium]
MHRWIGLTLRWLHHLDRHEWLDTSLFAWLVFALLLLAPLPIVGYLPGGAGLSVVLVGLAMGFGVSRWWGRRHLYVHFVPTASLIPNRPQPPLRPGDKLLLHVVGYLGVEGKEADFTGLIAYYRTFETREHAVMARQTPSRFWWGRTPGRLLGMWYYFVQPHELRRVVEGQVYFGAQPQPALRLHVTRTNAKGKPVSEIAYFIFANEDDRARVAVDLRLDMGGPAAIPWRPPA